MSSIAPDAQPNPADFELCTLSIYGARPGELYGVGFWPRAIARLIDFVVYYIIAYGTGLFFGLLILVASAGHPNPAVIHKLQQPSFSAIIFAIIGQICFHTICEGMHGSTPGKLVLSLVVVQEDVSPCRVRSAFIRSLGYPVDALFFGLIGYFAMQNSVQEQRHGDNWAHTVVCRRNDLPPEILRSGLRFTAALLLAIMAKAALLMIDLLLKMSR